nr:protein jagunal homolog 1-like [Tanacetum cinerariifolium]
AVVLLVAVFPILLTLLKKEPLETLSAASISIIFISVIIGELGRKRSRANFLKFYRVASSIGILGTIASVIQSSLQLKRSFAGIERKVATLYENSEFEPFLDIYGLLF